MMDEGEVDENVCPRGPWGMAWKSGCCWHDTKVGIGVVVVGNGVDWDEQVVRKSVIGIVEGEAY